MTPTDPAIDLSPDHEACTVLVADDSATIRASLVRTMPSDITVIEATDGEQAWELLQSTPDIRLLISDLDMPILNGYELVDRIRQSGEPRLVNLPVIILTASEDTQIKSRAFIAGANDFVPKKFDKVELLARVRVHQKLAQTIAELEASRENLRKQADRDELTGILNRRSFFGKVRELQALMQRHNEELSVLMLDLDHFKTVNDNFGHPAGDKVLKEAAAIFLDKIRDGDLLARLGGEEFIIAAPYAGLMAALVLGERIRKAIETHRFTYNGKEIPVTVSVGISTAEGHQASNLDDTITQADKRLYIAKNKGRNRVCASDTNERLVELVTNHPVRPKVDAALQMLEHGKEENLFPHLSYLLMKLMPLLKLANKHGDKDIDLENYETLISEIDARFREE